MDLHRSPALVRPGWQRAILLLWLLATALLVALGVHYAGTTGSWLDARVQRWLVPRRVTDERGTLLLLARLGSPWAVAAGSAAVAALAALVRWPRGVVLALAAPVLSGALAEWVLKPLVGRTKGLDLAFPSGAAAGAFGLAATVCVLLAAPAAAPRRLAPGVRLLVGLAACAVASVVGVALVALGWHYATDVVGGAATGVSATLATAAMIDLLSARVGVSR